MFGGEEGGGERDACAYGLIPWRLVLLCLSECVSKCGSGSVIVACRGLPINFLFQIMGFSDLENLNTEARVYRTKFGIAVINFMDLNHTLINALGLIQ